jgi:hypothetical protein
MEIVRATEKDAKELSEFVNSYVLHGDFSFQFVRSPSYFDKFKLRSDDFETYLLRGADNKIAASGSLVFENTYINGQQQKICWLVDLRIGSDRKAALHWVDHFFQILFERSRTNGCKHIFSVIFKDQKHNLASLIRPQSRKRQIPQFLHMKNFEMVSIHAKLPSFQSILSSIKIRRLNPNRLEELCLYLNQKTENRLFGTPFSPDLISKRLKEWPGFLQKNFFVCYDRRKNIVGCYALWDAKKIQELKLIEHGPHSRNFYYATKFLSLFGLARPMAKNSGLLDFYYMTHLYCDNSDIFERMLHHAFFRTRKKFLVYPQFEDHYVQLPPKQFMHQNLNFALYTILPHGESPDPELRQKPFSPPPDLEPWCI